MKELFINSGYWFLCGAIVGAAIYKYIISKTKPIIDSVERQQKVIDGEEA